MLGLGLNTVPGPNDIDDDTVMQDLAAFERRVRIRWQFIDAGGLPRYRVPNPDFVPDEATRPVEKFLQDVRMAVESVLNVHPPRKQPNIPKVIRDGIESLRKRRDIVVKAADKNMGTVVVDAAWYRDEAMRQLGDATTYRCIVDLDTEADQQRWPEIVTSLREELTALVAEFAECQWLDAKEIEYILNEDFDSLPQFYLTIKIHKDPVAGRPIVPSHSWQTTPASIWLADHLHPLLGEYSTHLPDSTTLIQILERRTFETDSWLVALDVVSLYPNIDIELGVAAIEQVLNESKATRMWPEDKKQFVIRLLRFVLSRNYLQFGSLVFLQLSGTAMGTSVAVAFACLFMAILERPVVEDPRFKSYIALYKRFVDDALVIWEGPRATLDKFITALNNRTPRIKWTHELSQSEIVHQDITIFKGPRFEKIMKFDIKTFQKKLNAHLYLPWITGHERHQKESFIVSETRRYAKTNSAEADFLEMRQLFGHRLTARGIPQAVIRRAFGKVRYKDRHTLIFGDKERERGDGGQPLVFVTTYTPRHDHLDLGGIIRHAYEREYVVHSQEMLLLFDARPMVAYRKGRTLGSYVTSAKWKDT